MFPLLPPWQNKVYIIITVSDTVFKSDKNHRADQTTKSDCMFDTAFHNGFVFIDLCRYF